MTPEEHALIAEMNKKIADVHGYIFSANRGKRPPRSDEIDELLDGARYGKWTVRLMLYLIGFVGSAVAAFASIKGLWK